MDSELIQQLQTGDLNALGELYQQYKDLVYRTALVVTCDERAAEDILQEAFVRLHTYAASVDGSRPLKPWLYRVTVNLSYDWLHKRRWIQPVEDLLEWLAGVPSAFPAPDMHAEHAELLHQVRDLVAALPETHRAVVMMFYMESLSLDEIAQTLELPLGTVKSRLHYARERLRERLTQRQRLIPELSYEFT